jgi:hypothetical protein
MELGIMKNLGTVLATVKSLLVNDSYRARVGREKAAYAAKRFGGRADVRVVGGEVRYYSPVDRTVYAVVSDSLKVRFFVSRTDGDHAFNLECV